MNFFGNSNNKQEGEQEPHKAHVSHGLIAAAAAFELTKSHEEHEKKEGKEVKHETLKELAAAAVGYEVTMLAESKGRDEVDHLKQAHDKKKLAQEQATQKKYCAPYKPKAEVVYEEEVVAEEETTY